ncbi:DUF7139 domain-containing protein [Halobellus captivus]|uniref:DUF7139 domain-containing protein n=1 Tax=Halobellus captivus TaxID=2592614 RepID=UPI0011A753C4|nr:ribonuclease BN [Halobellus captivus]
MPSLSEVYRGKQTGASLRRLFFGLGLFLAGALLVVSGIVVATTDLLYGSDVAALTAKRQLGAVLAGVGIPSVFLGIFAVLPSGRLTKAAAVVGAGIAVVGVALFTYAYPCHWSGSLCANSTPDLTLLTVGIYFLGAMLTFWCLFVGVANFKTRNDPGGTAMVNVTRRHETRYVPVERPRSGFGGIGFFGGTPDGEVETQTGSAGPGPTSDGGTDAEVISSPLDDSPPTTSAQGPQATGGPSSTARQNAAASGPTSRQHTGQPGPRNYDAADHYCGNCAHFEYVRTDSGIEPYCGAHEELMDDMDPCEDWSARPNR